MDIYVTSMEKAFHIARDYAPSTIISIINPQEDIPVFTPAPALHRAFAIHDIPHDRHHLQSATHSDILELVDCFLEHDYQKPLLIHCLLGSSRSTAAAYIFLNIQHHGRELEIAQYLRAKIPHAYPNPSMIQHADSILGRDGRMIKAIESLPVVDLQTLGEIGKLSTNFT